MLQPRDNQCGRSPPLRQSHEQPGSGRASRLAVPTEHPTAAANSRRVNPNRATCSAARSVATGSRPSSHGTAWQAVELKVPREFFGAMRKGDTRLAWIDENTMKAIVQDTYGSADVLELRDIDKPEIGDDEVLVRVHAAGVDRGVWHVMTGLPYPIRLAGFGLRAPKTRFWARTWPASWRRSART